MLCLSRSVMVYVALVSLFTGCPQSNAPNLASAPSAVPKTEPFSEKNTARTEGQERPYDPILDENYEARLFAPSAAVPRSGPPVIAAVGTRLHAQPSLSPGGAPGSAPPLLSPPALPLLPKWESLQIARL